MGAWRISYFRNATAEANLAILTLSSLFAGKGRRNKSMDVNMKKKEEERETFE